MALSLFGVAGAGAFVVASDASKLATTLSSLHTRNRPRARSHCRTEFERRLRRSAKAVGFVLMALTAPEISAVMNEPARDLIRIVGGYEAAPSTEEQAQVCLQEMESIGALTDR